MPSFRTLNREFRPWAEGLFNIARRYHLKPQLTSSYRSLRRQRILYDKYLRGEHPFPVAPPGQSLHNYGLAIDMTSRHNAWLAEIWQYWGGSWGGSRDYVHFAVRR